jgi:hypothetical protein
MNKTTLANYPLTSDLAIRDWLACGTITSPIENLADIVPADGAAFGQDKRWVLNYWAWSKPSKRIKKRVYEQLPPFTWQAPIEHPTLGAEGIGDKKWRYARTGEDQVIDFSLFNFNPTLMQGWLFTLLDAEQAMSIEAELLTIGPARVFLNGKLHSHYSKEFSYVALQRIPIKLSLEAGLNPLYLHGEMLAWREARLALGLRFKEALPLSSRIPLGTIPAAQWHKAQNGLEALQVKQFAFPNLPALIQLDSKAESPFSFIAEVELPIPDNIFSQLKTIKRPKGEAQLNLKPGESGELPIVKDVVAGMSGMPGENSLRLTLRPADGTPLTIHREIWAGKNQFSHSPYGDYESRRQEALNHLATMPFDIPSALAALELGIIETVPSEAVGLACHFMEHRNDCADFYAIGLIALMIRYGDKGVLKAEDQARIEAAFKGFKYWIDESGLDAMCYFTENHQILFHVACYLAGQQWPDWVFSNSNRSGKEQMQRSRPRIENWILRRLQGNFSEWDSNAYMTLDAFAMLALVEYAESPRLQEMATTLLHKIFFLLACQSFRGAHASSHGRCYVTALKSARVENTSILQRIAWGMGLLNGETRASGLLATAHRYRLPELIQAIGADVEAEVLTHTRSRAQFRPQFDMRGDFWDVRTITYRNADVMLSAAVDYEAGSMGIQEHLWQATLSPEASVFTTYPGNSQEHGNARPNFWAGSAKLPRVGMHERSVICLYQLEKNIGLGFSHAYFPVANFDETHIEGQWAFARRGNGYIALWGDGELVLTASGEHVSQELRSKGAGEAWLCHVGSASLDGDFAQFRQKVMAHSPELKSGLLHWRNPQGQDLAFGWHGALMLNGQAVSWEDFPHYQNLYTDTPMNAKTMTIRHKGSSLTLDLAKGKVLEEKS